MTNLHPGRNSCRKRAVHHTPLGSFQGNGLGTPFVVGYIRVKGTLYGKCNIGVGKIVDYIAPPIDLRG